MIIPLCTNGGDVDMFEKNPWDYNNYEKYCEDRYGVKPSPNLAEKQYGGKNLKAASNIVFR